MWVGRAFLNLKGDLLQATGTGGGFRDLEEGRRKRAAARQGQASAASSSAEGWTSAWSSSAWSSSASWAGGWGSGQWGYAGQR